MTFEQASSYPFIHVMRNEREWLCSMEANNSIFIKRKDSKIFESFQFKHTHVDADKFPCTADSELAVELCTLRNRFHNKDGDCVFNGYDTIEQFMASRMDEFI